MTISDTTQWNTASQAVLNAESILIVTHIHPDGDAIGSLLGLGNALRSLGKAVDWAVDDGCPGFLSFLPGVELTQSALSRGSWDLLISVDASDEERTGKVGEYGRANSKVVINIDHHATNTLFGDIHLVDALAVSATQVIFEWLRRMDFVMTQEVALPLLAGLITDTLGFRTSNVTAETLAVAQQLMEAGASLTEITERTLDNKSILDINLWKYALATVEMHEGGVIVAEVTQESVKKSGLNPAGDQNHPTDAGLVGFLVKVNEAMVAVVFKEDKEGRINISMRSKPGFDVAAVAFELGGGGHKQAAGATIDGPMEDARKRVLPLVKAAARKGKLVIA